MSEPSLHLEAVLTSAERLAVSEKVDPDVVSDWLALTTRLLRVVQRHIVDADAREGGDRNYLSADALQEEMREVLLARYDE